MQCKKCDRSFLNEEMIAFISGSIMGDEVTHSYFLCPLCGVYTVAKWWDNFTGLETMSLSGPLPKQEGDERVALIRKCPRSWNKKCRCAAHCDYFNNALDG